METPKLSSWLDAMGRYYLAHLAGFAALGKACVDLAARQWEAVVADLIAAGAAFGVAIRPAPPAVAAPPAAYDKDPPTGDWPKGTPK